MNCLCGHAPYMSASWNPSSFWTGEGQRGEYPASTLVRLEGGQARVCTEGMSIADERFPVKLSDTGGRGQGVRILGCEDF